MAQDISQLPYLTPEELLLYQTGKLKESTLKMRNFNRAPETGGLDPIESFAQNAGEYLSEKPLYDRPLFGIGDIGPAINRGVQDLKTPNPDSLRVVNNAKSLIGNTIDLPADLARSGYEKVAPAVNNAVDAVTMTEREFAEREKQNMVANALADETDDGLQQQRIAAFDQLMGQQGGAGAPIDLGPAQQNFGGYSIPAPPKGPDYSGVQDAIDQTKPNWNEAEIQEQRKGAILTGLVGGMLKAAIDGDPVFESAGLGTLKGLSVAAEDRRQQQDTFKKALDQYWLRTADVRKSQSESDADYSQRVWQTRVQQLQANANASEARARANGASIRQAGDKFFIEETVNGRRQMRALDLGLINNAAGMEKQITNLVGDEKKAQSIVQEVVARKDPEIAMPMITTARMKNNGSYMEFAQTLGNADPDWFKSFQSVGTQAASLGLDESSMNKMADARRDAMIVDILYRDPTARAIAYKLTGMDEQYLREKAEQQKLTPRVK